MRMSSENVVLSVKHISKCFEIYEKPIHRLWQTLCAGHKKFYQPFWALEDVSFDVLRGESVGIIGRNGAGKSTLLQIITGTLQPTSGSVTVNGRVAALLELGSGFNPEFTGRENVYLNASILGLSPRQIDEKYQDIVEFADIGKFIDQPVKTYSSGMMVRLAFAVITHVEADILIIDEALAVGDAFFQQKCMRFLRNFMQDHTVLFVSHDVSSVQSLCNKALLLKNGRLEMNDTPKQVIDRYLKDIYAAQQTVENVRRVPPESICQTNRERKNFHDMRMKFLNSSNLRNDIELVNMSDFSSSDAFGTGQVRIREVYFSDEEDRPLKWVVGGEIVKIKMEIESSIDLDRPIAGFILKNRTGQDLFVENTFLTYLDHPPLIEAGSRFTAVFTFRMPVLARGDYSLSVAVANGTQHDHVQHHWVNDALIIKSRATHALGMVGLDMMETSFISD